LLPVRSPRLLFPLSLHDALPILDLWIARRDGIRWVDPQPLPFNTPGTETEPAFSPDGRWLYFASEREDGRGGLDLYRVAFDGQRDRKSTRLNSSHVKISYAVFCL